MRPIARRFAAMAALAAAALLSIQAVHAQEAEDPDLTYGKNLLKAGTPAPGFSIPDLQGEVRTLADFKGKTVLMDFWATWCPDCRKEVDSLLEIHRDFPDVQMVGVSFDTDADRLRKFTQDKGMDWMQLCSLEKWKETRISRDYHIEWIPTIYIIGPDGKVLLATVETSKARAFLEAGKTK